MAIPSGERERILRIAREVRRHVRRAAGAYCPPEGLCGEASLALSVRLTRAGIPHENWGGAWQGPMVDEFGEPDTSIGPGSAQRLHAWIEFPQYDGAILDVTADQFTDVPPIWFPANKSYYEKLEKFDAEEIFKAAAEGSSFTSDKGESRHIAEPIIPLEGPLYRRAKVTVREHLRHPPRSCLCHRFKSVDRVRRKMVRRLK